MDDFSTDTILDPNGIPVVTQQKAVIVKDDQSGFRYRIASDLNVPFDDTYINQQFQQMRANPFMNAIIEPQNYPSIKRPPSIPDDYQFDGYDPISRAAMWLPPLQSVDSSATPQSPTTPQSLATTAADPTQTPASSVAPEATPATPEVADEEPEDDSATQTTPASDDTAPSPTLIKPTAPYNIGDFLAPQPSTDQFIQQMRAQAAAPTPRPANEPYDMNAIFAPANPITGYFDANNRYTQLDPTSQVLGFDANGIPILQSTATRVDSGTPSGAGRITTPFAAPASVTPGVVPTNPSPIASSQRVPVTPAYSKPSGPPSPGQQVLDYLENAVIGGYQDAAADADRQSEAQRRAGQPNPNVPISPAAITMNTVGRLLAPVSNSVRNFAQGALAPGLDRYDQSAAGQNPSTNVWQNVWNMGAPIWQDVPGNIRSGVSAIHHDNGDQRIGRSVPELAPNTVAGALYNGLTAAGSDPTNLFLAQRNLALTAPKVAAELIAGRNVVREAQAAGEIAKASEVREAMRTAAEANAKLRASRVQAALPSVAETISHAVSGPVNRALTPGWGPGAKTAVLDADGKLLRYVNTPVQGGPEFTPAPGFGAPAADASSLVRRAPVLDVEAMRHEMRMAAAKQALQSLQRDSTMLGSFNPALPKRAQGAIRIARPVTQAWFATMHNAIANVHYMPRHPVEFRPSVARVNYGGFYYPTMVKRNADLIYVSKYGPTPHLTLAHEMGHLVDRRSLTNRKIEATEQLPSWRSRNLAGWRRAVANSSAVKGLKTTLDTTKNPKEKMYVKYLLSHHELWARSYAQYIAMKSQHPEMLSELRTIQKLAREKGRLPRQWQDDDFAPIMSAIDNIMRLKGLNKK